MAVSRSDAPTAEASRTKSMWGTSIACDRPNQVLELHICSVKNEPTIIAHLDLTAGYIRTTYGTLMSILGRRRSDDLQLLSKHGLLATTS